jgi:hypothetical protein
MPPVLHSPPIQSTTSAAPVACDFAPAQSRDPALRRNYLLAAEAAIPRILASVDRNPFGPSYGCCDLQYWHYRTASFPSEMYQEAALPLASAYAVPRPGSRWHGEARLVEAATAAIRFSAESAHADGSCDDYYPFERALGAAVFSLAAQAEAYRLLDLDDAKLVRFLAKRAEWIAAHDESGRLANHHALAALALWRTAQLVDSDALRDAARGRVEKVPAWQSSEGWFEEYGGADPGYQSVTIECLAKLRREANLAELAEPLARAVEFAGNFLHLDDGYGGVYGSRGTRHCYPAGWELLAGELADAADLADAQLRSLAAGTVSRFDDDRMYVHRVASLFDAYDHWSPLRPDKTSSSIAAGAYPQITRYPDAGLFIVDREHAKLIVSATRGGTFLWQRRVGDRVETHVDAGLVVECHNGRIAVAQTHDRSQPAVEYAADGANLFDLTLVRMLSWSRFERVTPLKQAALHLGMTTVGRFARGLVRRLLQRRTIAANGASPIRVRRSLSLRLVADVPRLTVTDEIELLDRTTTVRRLAWASDLQAAYTAAANSFDRTLLEPWRDGRAYVEQLNRDRKVTVVHEL